MHLTIRADGGPEIGYGHLVRTGALAAEFLRHGHNVTYCTRSPGAVQESTPNDVEIIEFAPDDIWSEFSSWLRDSNTDLVLTDSYEADGERQRTITQAVSGPSGVVVDDARFEISTDFVINGNVYAPSLEYEWTGTEPIWFLGTDYLSIRKEICELTTEIPEFRHPPERALVTMGGSDVNDVTPRVMRAFDGVDVSLTVVIGPGFSNRDKIQRSARDVDCEIELKEDPDNFPKLMAEADLAVSASGSTMYELLALGTPTIAIPQADNQVPVAKALAERDTTEWLELRQLDTLTNRLDSLVSDPECRRRYRESGRDLVDCRGTIRLYNGLITL